MAEFPWVLARAACSASEVFTRLQLQIEKDVDARNLQIAGRGAYEFKLSMVDGVFAVGIQWNGPPKLVRFKLSGDKIVIESGDGEIDLVAAVTLNNDGECRLVIGGVELEEWQVRKKALEKLFFRTA